MIGETDRDAAVVVLGHRLWRGRFGGDPEIVGKTLLLANRRYDIVGVAPQSFAGISVGEAIDVFLPLSSTAKALVIILGRVHAGNDSLASATGRLVAAQPSIRESSNPYTESPYREEYLSEPFSLRPASTGISPYRGRYARALWLLLIATALLLLLACNTVTTLLWSKTIAKETELKIRAAVGASRWQLIRPQLLEGLLLVLCGVVGGALIAPASVGALKRAVSNQSTTVSLDSVLDYRTFVVVALIAVAGTVIVCWSSAWHALRLDRSTLQRTHDAVSGVALRLGNVGVAIQLAVSVVLLTFTFVFVHNYQNIASRDTGFDTERLLIATASFPSRKTSESMRELYPLIEQTVRGVPGVANVGVSLVMPGGNTALTPWLELRDGTRLPQGMQGVMSNPVSAHWLDAMGIVMLDGRGFNEADISSATRVAIVNRTFQKRFLPDGYRPGTVLIQRTEPDAPAQPLEIIGVTEDSSYLSAKDAFPPTIYLPLTQANYTSRMPLQITVRAEGNPASLTRTVADAIGRVEPTAGFTFRTLADQVGAQYAQERLMAGLSLFLGGFALILASVGVYAVLASTVARRQFEVAIRMAVGATPGHIVGSMFGRAVVWSGIGAAVGIALTLITSQLITGLVFELDPSNGVFRLESVGILLLSVTAGAAVPAIRAVRVNAAQLLR